MDVAPTGSLNLMPASFAYRPGEPVRFSTKCGRYWELESPKPLARAICASGYGAVHRGRKALLPLAEPLPAAGRLCPRPERRMFAESLAQDVRYAWRGARRSPLFAVSVAGTIGIGLGVLCSWFTIVNAYLFKRSACRSPPRCTD